MFSRRALAAAALALLLLVAALPAHLHAAAYGCKDIPAPVSGILGCGNGHSTVTCKGCISCDVGYYLSQTYDEASATYTGMCVQDTASTEGCANITATPVPLREILADTFNPFGIHCLSCKKGYDLVEHVALDATKGEMHYGICERNATVPLDDSANGQTETTGTAASNTTTTARPGIGGDFNAADFLKSLGDASCGPRSAALLFLGAVVTALCTVL